jgi:hypothetical protein
MNLRIPSTVSEKVGKWVSEIGPPPLPLTHSPTHPLSPPNAP